MFKIKKIKKKKFKLKRKTIVKFFWFFVSLIVIFSMIFGSVSVFIFG